MHNLLIWWKNSFKVELKICIQVNLFEMFILSMTFRWVLHHNLHKRLKIMENHSIIIVHKIDQWLLLLHPLMLNGDISGILVLMILSRKDILTKHLKISPNSKMLWMLGEHIWYKDAILLLKWLLLEWIYKKIRLQKLWMVDKINLLQLEVIWKNLMLVQFLLDITMILTS